MNLEKLLVLCTACLFAASPAIAAEWSEFEPNAAIAAEPLDLNLPTAAETVVQDDLHATGGQTDKPDDANKDKSDSKS
jgi:hypothetical protein